MVIWGVTSELIAHMDQTGHEGCPDGPGLLARSELSRKKSVLSVLIDKGG